MATTEEEWESLFRNRLENYESEPNEDALERILGGANPPPVAKPGGKLGRRLGWSLGVLAILSMLTFGVWQYQTLSAHAIANSVAVSTVAAKNETAQAAVSPQAMASTKNTGGGQIVNPATSSEKHTRQHLTPATETVQPLVEIPAIETVTLAGATEKKQRKPHLTESVLAMVNGQSSEHRQSSEFNTASEKNNVSKQKPYNADEANFTFNQSTNLTATKTAPEFAKPELELHFIAGRASKLSFPVNTLPTISTPVNDIVINDLAPVIEPTRLAAKPSFYTSVMPLYTFRQVTPTLQDNVVVEKIRPAKSFSARTGYRFQVGAEFPVSRTFGVRVSAAYQKLQQEMTYSERALRSDSSKVEWVDPQTIKLTPLYKSEERHVKNTWQYVALSAEGRLRLNRGQTTGLQHFISAGGSVGYLMSGRSKERWQPFLQASYGIERQLTDKLRLQVEPGIVYNLSAINDNSRCFSVRPYSYGLVIGLRWQP